MFNYRVIAVIKRELRERILSKAFILMTLLFPVLMFGFIALQTLLMNYDGDEGVNIEIVTFSDSLSNSFKEEFSDIYFVTDSTYTINYVTMDSSKIKEYIEERKSDLLSEKLTGILYISPAALNTKAVDYFSKTPKNLQITRRLQSPINKILVEEYFRGKNISDEDLGFARRGVDIAALKVSKDEDIKEEGYGNIILSYLFSFLLYISLLMMGSLTMQTVIQEKTGRINEVLLSSVSSKDLMMGKILGASITGSLQMAIWLSPVMLVISTSFFALPPEFTFSITFDVILYMLVNFFMGLLIFVGLFATVGSIFENPQDAQSGMWPIMLLIIIPFFIAISLMKNPANPIAVIASMFPFAAVIVMPARMTLVDVPMWQIIISFLVNVGTLVAIFPLAGKIYRIGILRTGKKPKWSEVIKWLKYKY